MHVVRRLIVRASALKEEDMEDIEKTLKNMGIYV